MNDWKWVREQFENRDGGFFRRVSWPLGWYIWKEDWDPEYDPIKRSWDTRPFTAINVDLMTQDWERVDDYHR